MGPNRREQHGCDQSPNRVRYVNGAELPALDPAVEYPGKQPPRTEHHLVVVRFRGRGKIARLSDYQFGNSTHRRLAHHRPPVFYYLAQERRSGAVELINEMLGMLEVRYDALTHCSFEQRLLVVEVEIQGSLG